MTAATDITASRLVSTAYYTSEGDDGQNTYFTRAVTAGVADGGSLIKSVGTPTIEFVAVWPGNRISPKQFGAVGDGTTDDNIALGNAVTYTSTNNRTLYFTTGNYSYSTALTFNQLNQVVEFEDGVILTFIGGGTSGILLDSGATGGVYNGRFGVGSPPIIRASLASNGVYVRAWHHGVLNVIVEAALNNAVMVEYAVLTQFTVEASVNRTPWVTQPTQGIVLNQRDAGEPVTACEIYAIIEGVSGNGIVCNSAQYNRFRGTSEGNTGGGYSESGTCIGNDLRGLFCEANGNTDFAMGGSEAILHNVVSNSPTSGLVVTGSRNFISGAFTNLQINAAATRNILSNALYLSTEAGGSFIDNGTGTIYDNLRMNSTAGSISIPNRATRPKIKHVGGITISGATNASECVLTIAGHNLDNGETIAIASVGGMTQLNGNSYTVEIRDNNSVWILSAGNNVDSTAFGTYTSGGTATLTAFLDVWTNAGGSFRSAGFSVSSEGIVNLVGTVTGGAVGNIFNLPVGYRPEAEIFVPSASSTPSAVYIRVNSNGNVELASGSNTSISLDAVTFRVI